MQERGQGLVEMALILPFLLVLVVGIVELGVALNRQLIVVNAAREGARFGAQGARPDDIYAQTRLATSQMLDFNEENAVIVVVHARTDDDGDFEWTEKVYPSGAPVPHVTQEGVLAELRAEGNADDVELVIVDVEYDHEAVLGFPFVSALMGQIPIGSWAAMRLETVSAGEPGCSAYPIAVHEDTLGGKEGRHVGDVVSPGNFGWLRWPEDPSYASAMWLRNFLADPGWSCGNPRPDEDYPGFQNADDAEDHELNVDDWVWGNAGGLSDSQEDQAALDRKRVRVVVWDSVSGGGNGAKYHVYGFAIVEITCDGAPAESKCRKTSEGPYNLVGQDRISVKFIRWDTACD